MEVGEVKTKKGNKGLIISLIILIVLMIGLAVGLILVFKKDESAPEQSSLIIPEDKVSFLSELREEADSAESEDEAISFFDRKIEEYKDTEFLVGIQLQKAKFLCDVGKSAEAIGLLDKILNEELTPTDKMEVYLTYEYVYSETGDELKAKEYNQKYWNEYAERFNGGESIE